ncbi:CDT1-like protein a [Pyrus ussuriensis x Pyrus communis]|uniref:CDT1-like protein a n=1 Tax=Pyrus ussuriensis x Pyrus communis TaxID=2448454 RepID=A0A5N5FLJ5_9ROSA|nr:CDT1-like protein a [Pyrus ussuriensis x Pyrus communis]
MHPSINVDSFSTTSRTPRRREKKSNKVRSTQTPQKSETLIRRARNTNFALSIGDFRKAAAKCDYEIPEETLPSHLVLRSKIASLVIISGTLGDSQSFKLQCLSRIRLLRNSSKWLPDIAAFLLPRPRCLHDRNHVN